MTKYSSFDYSRNMPSLFSSTCLSFYDQYVYQHDYVYTGNILLILMTAELHVKGFIGTVFSSFQYAIPFLILAMSFERYIMIAHPIFSYKFSERRNRIIFYSLATISSLAFPVAAIAQYIWFALEHVKTLIWKCL